MDTYAQIEETAGEKPERSEPWHRLVWVFLILMACSWLGIRLSRASEGVATIWLSNGMVFGLMITKPRRLWLRYLAIGLAADTLADVIWGDPFHLAIGVSLANSVEVLLSAYLLTRWFGSPLNLAKRRPLVGFLFTAVIGATAVTSALGATWTLMWVHAGGWLQMFRTWYLGDMLGMALMAPLVYMFQRPGFFSVLHPRQMGRTVLLLLVPVLVTIMIFSYDKDPLIFFIFPALLLIVFRLGFSGTVLAVVLIAVIGIAMTITGHGPLMLIRGSHMMLHRIVVVQIFTAVMLFTSFPVAALLEERAALQLELTKSEARYRQLAHADALTGLPNRRAFDQELDERWKRAAAEASSLALLLIDVDLFKTYNDIYGHVGGDECLRCIASTISQVAVAEGWQASRYGGEEFAILIPGAEPTAALRMGDEVRRAVSAMKLQHLAHPLGIQTISVGVAAITPRTGQRATELLTLADRALYRAKGLGRNRVVCLWAQQSADGEPHYEVIASFSSELAENADQTAV